MPGNGSLEANLAGLPPILGGVTRAPNLLRPLQASDFGVKSLKALEGSLRVDGSLAIVTIRNIEGNLGHYMDEQARTRAGVARNARWRAGLLADHSLNT
jgi:hypothetical protein